MQAFLENTSLFRFPHRVYNITPWKSNLPEEAEHIKMIAVLGSFHGSLKARDRCKLGSTMHPINLEFPVSS
jgi:hypothetical protein